MRARVDRATRRCEPSIFLTRNFTTARMTKIRTIKTLPARSKVKTRDTWNLDSLFKSDADWEKAFKKWEKQIPGYDKFKGKLGQSAEMLAACLQFDAALDRAAERLMVYAHLRTTEDQGNSDSQRMRGRFIHVNAQAQQAASFIRPEILSIKPATIANFMQARELAEWKWPLEQILRYRPHTLSKREEELLAMQGPMSDSANQAFRQLNDADLKWPTIKNEKGQLIELGHSSFSAFLHSPSRKVRQEAFHMFYKQYDAHKNTIAATLNGSNQRDAYYAKVRGFKSAREAALFDDNMPLSVYDNLIDSVHANLKSVHRYYDLRRRAMKLKDIHHYDCYVPILSEIEKHHTWDQAVRVVVDALEPLGDEYCGTLRAGLTTERWCDRYPNAGKQSGAFSAGSFDGKPYILMNYQPSVLDHVFTLAHEAGHSMHSYFSCRNQPFQYWKYV